ncbi:MAG: hypothetical protein QXE05_05575 [Nitrososphaeria archaeon]
MDMGDHYVCYFWSNASICALVAKKQNAKGYIVHIIFRSDDVGSDVSFFIDTETRTVKSHSAILTFLMKRPKKVSLILKSLDGLKEFIEELIEAVPTDEEGEKKTKNKTQSDAAVPVVNFS